jgi:hypothetical protein
MSGTLARSDREAKEAAERRAQLAEARVRELEERLDLALAAITEARAEGERLRGVVEVVAAADDDDTIGSLKVCGDIVTPVLYLGEAARAALVSPSPRPAENGCCGGCDAGLPCEASLEPSAEAAPTNEAKETSNG